MLEIRNLDAFYGESHVLQGVELSVDAGEVVTLVGRNGAGKTTLLKSIIGDIPRRTGSIRFGGSEIIGLSPESICRMGVGFVPEDRGIFSTLNVYENLTVGRPNGSTGWPLERIYQHFPVLKARRLQKAASLSGGEKQMLAIARILRTGANLLLLDEPTEGLAPVIVQQIGVVIRKLKERGFTVLLVEQNFRFASKLADRHYVVEHGRVIDTLSAADVAGNLDRIQSYLKV